MQTVLVVNAGSSSVKFQVFEIVGADEIKPLIRGEMDGIGVRPRLRARDADGAQLIDQQYPAGDVPNVPTAIRTAGTWLRNNRKLKLIAVGHRVVHGGPHYDRPVLVDDAVLAELERFVPLAPLHQPNNLAPIRAIRERLPDLPQVACFDTAFHRGHQRGRGSLCHSRGALCRGRAPLRLPRPVLRVRRRRLRGDRSDDRQADG